METSIDIKMALNEILDIAPMYRRDYIIRFLRENLPLEDAKKALFQKRKKDFLKTMMSENYTSAAEIVDQIGPERVRQYFHRMSRMS